MVTQYGMSEQLGHLTYGSPMRQSFMSSPFAEPARNYSERTAEQIDEEVRRLIDAIYSRVRQILTTRRADLDRMADALVKRETLTRDDLQALLASPVAAAAAAPSPHS
jgi:cell division protease FtsH